MYTIQFGPAAYRVFKKLPKEIQNEIRIKVKILKEEPLIGQPLQGVHRKFRSIHFNYKGTAYRIIYQVSPKTSLIVIRLADKRENIYKRLIEMGN